MLKLSSGYRSGAVQSNRQGGYLLIEVALAVGLLTLLSVKGLLIEKRQQERRDIDYTVSMFTTLVHTANGYWRDQNRWPANLNVFLTYGGLLHRVSLDDSWGRQVRYSVDRTVRPEQARFTVDAPTEDIARRLRLRLGATAIQTGEQVTLTLVPPPFEQSHIEFLPRSGGRPMTGNLDMDSGLIHNLGGANLSGEAEDGVIKWQNTERTARLIVDELWVRRIHVNVLNYSYQTRFYNGYGLPQEIRY